MSDNKFILSGKLVFDVEKLTKKHLKQSSWKRTAIILIDNTDFCRYYSWFIKKRYNLELQMPIRGLHLTLINDRVTNEIDYLNAVNKYQGKRISFEYDTNLQTNGKTWWLPAYCEEGEKIRELAGLSKKPYYDFHISIGRADGDLRIEHSMYIYRLITNFGNEFF